MTIEALLSQFIDAWNAGQRPRVEEYLERAETDKRDELAAQIRAFLETAPTPRYSEEALAEIMREPAMLAAQRTIEGASGLWPALLPRLRRRARLRRDELVAHLAGRLGVSGNEAKVARYYHGMETGTLEPAGVSRRVLDALAAILGASGDELAEAGEFRGLHRTGTQAAFGRTYQVEAEALEAIPPAAPGAGEAGWDEVDELFRGGR